MTITTYTDPSAWWASMQSGDMLGMALGPFTSLMDVCFYVFIAFMGMLLIYFKSQNFGYTTTVGILILGGFLPYIAAMQGYQAILPVIYIKIVMGVATMLYRVFK